MRSEPEEAIAAAGDYRLTEQIVRLVGAQAGVHACMAGLRMAVPLFALHLGHGAAVAGALVALFGVSQLLLSLPAGRLADRGGVRRAVYGGALVALLGALVAAAWPTVPGLAVAALLEGGAIAVVVVVVQRQAGRLARDADELRRVFSWASFTPAASNFIGPALTGLAIDAWGFRYAFLMLAAGPLFSLLFVRRAHELPPVPVSAVEGSGTLQLWRDPTLRRVLLMNGFVAATWELHSVMVPLLGHSRGLSAAAIGGILGSFAVAAAFVRLLVPWAGQHLREWQLIAGALATASLMLALYPFVETAVAMASCSILLGVSSGGVQPIVMALLHQHAPPHLRGQAAALRLVLINASSISMPMMAGVAGGLVGTSAVFWAGSALMVLGVRMATGLRQLVPPPSH